MIHASSLRFGTMTEVAKYSFGGETAYGHSLEERLQFAREKVAHYRNQGTPADCFAFRWYDAMRDPEAEEGSTLYSRSTHSGGYKTPADVFIVTGQDAEAFQKIGTLQRMLDQGEIDQQGTRQDSPLKLEASGLLDPMRLESATKAFIPPTALKHVTPSHTLLGEFMRFVFSNVGMGHVKTGTQGILIENWQPSDYERILG